MRIPSAGTPVSPGTLLASTLGVGGQADFESALARFLDASHVRLTGSGTSALFAILQTLAARDPGRREVVMPAYTAPSLVLPIRKAGLDPVLADTSTSSLNADSDRLLERVTPNTLAVMPVHMYGLASDTDVLADALDGSGVAIVEDACSSQGTTVNGRQSGTWGDIGFYSFNRGKNMATLAGGAFSTDDADLAEEVTARLEAYPAPGPPQRLKNVAYTWALAAAVRPAGYSALYPFVSRFKYTDLHTDFTVRRYTPFQARVGLRLLRRFDRIAEPRRDNAAFVRGALADVEGVRLPDELAGSAPVYNQCPVLLPDPDTRQRAHERILETGLEATLLYPDPVHRIYPDIWDGAGPDPCPEATDISRRILLFPVHPLVPRDALTRAVDIVRDTVASMAPAAAKEAQP